MCPSLIPICALNPISLIKSSVMPAIKFSDPSQLPEGFLYRENFLSETEETDLVRIFGGLDFAAYDYHGYQAKRRVARYGVNYDINTGQANQGARPIPEFLLGIRDRAAHFAGVPPGDLAQAMVSEYSTGTPIGWHRDAPQFGVIIGISLASACRMRLKPYLFRGKSRAGSPGTTPGKSPGKLLSLRLEPRSIYVMKGEARSAWQHSIPAVDQLRYSITFRTLRSGRESTAA